MKIETFGDGFIRQDNSRLTQVAPSLAEEIAEIRQVLKPKGLLKLVLGVTIVWGLIALGLAL